MCASVCMCVCGTPTDYDLPIDVSNAPKVAHCGRRAANGARRELRETAPNRTRPGRRAGGQGLGPVPGLGLGHSHFGSQSYNLMLRHLPYTVYGLFAADITTMWVSLLRLGIVKNDIII